MKSIKKIIMHHVQMTLNNSFSTSFGTVKNKEFFIIEAINEDGIHGYGESVAFTTPWYTEETFNTTKHILIDFLIPLIQENKYNITHPNDLSTIFSSIRGNNMAKSAIENAIWDLYAKQMKRPLYQLIGGTRGKIDVGVSLGIEKDTNNLLDKISWYVSAGYKRIKIKVKKGYDVKTLTDVRKHFPHISLMIDANSAYTLDDIDHLKQLDDFNLLMIEQPLGHDDIIDHAKLQAQMKTPICLDESIHSIDDVKQAITLNSCKIINVKLGRVGGIHVAKQIHDLCEDNGIDLWCGGMLEAGIGRAHNIALATLPAFTLPGDIAASSHYWQEDIIKPKVTVENGQIKLSNEPGIGYELDYDLLKKYTVQTDTFKF